MSKVAWEPVIGLEVHVQLGTDTKAFSASAARFGGAPNSHTDPTVLGLPGALPCFNRRALRYALRLGIALGCDIRRRSRFARKQYFYPDLPKGYQISQFDEPLCEGGSVPFVLGGQPHAVPLTRIHLEEDAGKSMHRGAVSLVNLNRAGVPLCEVVSEPAIASAAEAAAYMRALRQLVRYLGISEGNMEQGHLRCDANVSVRPRGQDKLGTRAELKNINSFKFVQRAIENEIARQIDILESGGSIVQETRLWDADAGVSRSMRSKEEAEDYRYFPDPDLPVLVVDESVLESVEGELPELPMAKRARYIETFSIPPDDADTLINEVELAAFFDATATALGGELALVRRASNWILAELLRELNASGTSLADIELPPTHLAQLIELIEGDTISGKIGKKVFATMLATGESPQSIVDRQGLGQISDTGALETTAQEIMEQHPDQVAQYRAGKTKLIGFFVGQLMKQTGGAANPKLVNQIFAKLLEK